MKSDGKWGRWFSFHKWWFFTLESVFKGQILPHKNVRENYVVQARRNNHKSGEAGYPGYQMSSFQRKYLDLWRPSVEISSRMCQSNSCRNNQRWRAKSYLINVRLYQYTCWLLKNSLEASKCNWNEFRSKEFFYTSISNY